MREVFRTLITQRSVVQIHPPQPLSGSPVAIGSHSRLRLIRQQASNGKTLLTTTLLTARLPSNIACV